MGRVITADIGNSNIVFGCWNDRELEFLDRVETHIKWTVQTLVRELRLSFRKHRIPEDEFEGSILSSVVPELNQVVVYALENLTGKKTFVMSRELDVGIRMTEYDLASLGIDRIVDVAAAAEFYGTPVAVYDLGTCTTLSAVNADRFFAGGMITPGIQLSLNSLAEHTATLPQLKAEKTDTLLGNDTVSCMLNGTVAATGIMMEGVLQRIRKEWNCPELKAIVTGGLGRLVLPWISGEVIYEPNLQLMGLLAIFRRNQGMTGHN